MSSSTSRSIRIALIARSLAALVPAAVASPLLAQHFWSFAPKPGAQTLTVPPGVTELIVDVEGGRGGQPRDGNGGNGGAGGRTIAKMKVRSGDVLTIFVGAAGEGAGGSGLGKGGDKGDASDLGPEAFDGGGGGGGTVVGMGVIGGSASLPAFADYVAAGGGGGGGGNTNHAQDRCAGSGGHAGEHPKAGGRGCVTVNDQGYDSGDSRGGGHGGVPNSTGTAAGGRGQDGLNAQLYSGGGGGGGGGGYFVDPDNGGAVVGGGGGGQGSQPHVSYVEKKPEVYERAAGGGAGGRSSVGSSGATTLVTYLTSNRPDGGVARVFVGGVRVFECTKSAQRFMVPAGVRSVLVEARGGEGGSPDNGLANSGVGGLGGVTIGTIPVTPGEVLKISVGCKGEGAGGFGGGRGGDKGDANFPTAKDGAGGGGSSEVARSAGDVPLIVAGGGGGGGGAGTVLLVGSGGDGGHGGNPPVHGHPGGYQVAPGSDGGDGGCVVGSDGCEAERHGTGGGNTETARAGGGGGGGGGGYSGGKGGHGLNHEGEEGSGAGGGGGGRSYAAPAVTEASFPQGVLDGNGQVVLEWATGPVTSVCASGCTYASIQAAVSAVAPGTDILIHPGTYRENVTIDRSVVLSASGSGTVIDGGGIASTVTVLGGAVVSLQGLTLTHGAATFGGGIRNLGTLTLVDVAVHANHATSGGGGISNEGAGTLAIYGGAIADNASSGRGGGVLNHGGATLLLEAVALRGNAARSEGGAIAVASGSVTIVQGTARDNAATDGGAVAVAGGAFRASEASVETNRATQRGGALYATGGLVTLEHMGISHNNADAARGGGAVFAGKAAVTITSSHIHDNASPQCVGTRTC